MPERPAVMPAFAGGDEQPATPFGIAGEYVDEGEAFGADGTPLGPVSLSKLLLGEDPALAGTDAVAVLSPAPDIMELRPLRAGQPLTTRRFSEYTWSKARAWDANEFGQPYYPANGFLSIDRGVEHAGAAGIGMYAAGGSCLLRKGIDGSLIVLRQDVAFGVVVVVPFAKRQDVWARFAPAGPRPAAAASDVVAINVLIEPDAAMTDAAIAANARLLERAPESFPLDADHVPHLTVLQRYVRRADLGTIGQAVDAAVGRSGIVGSELTATGLYDSPFAGLAMAGIRVTPTPALLALQEALVGAVAPFAVPVGTAEAFLPEAGGTINAATLDYVRDFVPTASGARYNPHVTVGAGDPEVVRQFVAGSFASLRFRVKAVGIWQLGNFGTARHRLP